VDKARWRDLCKARTTLMAKDFCEMVVEKRRILDDRPKPDWGSLITKWFDEERSTRRKGFF
jgi:hypothetical protein